MNVDSWGASLDPQVISRACTKVTADEELTPEELAALRGTTSEATSASEHSTEKPAAQPGATSEATAEPSDGSAEERGAGAPRRRLDG